MPLGRREETEQMREGKKKKKHQCRKIKPYGGFECVLRQPQLWDHQTGEDDRESLEKQALEKLPLDSNVLSATARLALFGLSTLKCQRL